MSVRQVLSPIVTRINETTIRVTTNRSAPLTVRVGIQGPPGPAGPSGGGIVNLALDTSTVGTLSGAIDGTNNSFTLSNTPKFGSALWIYVNGLLQDPGDFTLTATTILLSVPPHPGDRLSATYIY